MPAVAHREPSPAAGGEPSFFGIARRARLAAGGYTLEWTSGLVNGSSTWTPVAPALLQTNGATVSYCETPAPTGSKFFRLHQY